MLFLAMIKLDAIFSDDQVPGRFWLKFFLFQYVGPMGFSMYRVVCMGVCQGFEIMTISSSDVPRRFLGGLGGSSEDLGGSSEDLGGSSEVPRRISEVPRRIWEVPRRNSEDLVYLFEGL